MRLIILFAAFLAFGAPQFTATVFAKEQDKAAPKARKPLAFCATERTKATAACADLPAAASNVPPPVSNDTNAKGETGKPQVGVRWNASNDSRADRNSTVNNVDSINKTLPGAPQGASDTSLGVGARWKVCLFCE